MSSQQEVQWGPAHPFGAALETELLQERKLPGGPLPASPHHYLPLLLLGSDSWRWRESPGPGDERGC